MNSAFTTASSAARTLPSAPALISGGLLLLLLRPART
jgi:hypothetical protein